MKQARTRLFLRAVLLGAPVVAASFALVTACSSDPSTSPSADASTDTGASADTGTSTDTGTSSDGSTDGGTDAPADAVEAEAPRLCKTYPNVSADASASEGPRRLYELIALRALLDAMGSCEIGQAFPDLEDPPPSQITCFGKQLAAVSGCLIGGAPIDYSKEIDENGAACVNVSTGVVQVGFRDPATNKYSSMDVDFMLNLVRKAAVSTGMAPADADRLKALIAAEKAKAASDAGPGYTNSTCP